MNNLKNIIEKHENDNIGIISSVKHKGPNQDISNIADRVKAKLLDY